MSNADTVESSNTTDDVLAFTLFRVSSNLKKLQKVRGDEFDLTTKESKTLGLLTSVFGDFDFNSSNLQGGTIDGFDVQYKSFGAVPITPFTMMSVEYAEIDVHKFLAAGYSQKSAQQVSKKMLKGNDEIIGSEYSESIKSYKGDDTITGGGGADELYGGKGNDVFVYNSFSDSEYLEGIDGTDTIYRFTEDKDKLDFSKLEANGEW
jgi:Ca2+-binding RTX toxin-like protein